MRISIVCLLVLMLGMRVFDESLNDPALAPLAVVWLRLVGRHGVSGLVSDPQCAGPDDPWVGPGWTGTDGSTAEQCAGGDGLDRLDGAGGAVGLGRRIAEPAVPSSTGKTTVATVSGRFTQYLGNDRNGVVTGISLNPDWAASPPMLLWRQECGPGLGGFAVKDGRAVLLEQRGDEEAVVCYEVATGMVVWVDTITTRHQTRFGGTGPRSTPTIHGDVVIIQGATGIRCLDLATGMRRWSVDLFALLNTDQAADESRVAWGRSGSPLVIDDALVVLPAGGAAGASISLIAFDLATGPSAGGLANGRSVTPHRCWLTCTGSDRSSRVNEATVTGHDPLDGRELWVVEQPGRSSGNASGSQPIVPDRMAC